MIQINKNLQNLIEQKFSGVSNFNEESDKIIREKLQTNTQNETKNPSNFRGFDENERTKLIRSTRKQQAERQEYFRSIFTKNRSIQEIRAIFDKSNKDKENIQKYEKLYKLLYDKELLLVAYANIANNYGSATPGTTKETIDGTTIETIDKLSKDLKNETFNFTPFRRILIPKPRKPGENKNSPTKKRPLGIPGWTDRIVQEALRIILNAIYEPIFYREGKNFGFRPKISCHHAIEYIKINGQGLNNVIEGDIKGAYDNVDFKILLEILQRKINDPRLLKLIHKSFKCGLMFKDHYQDTLLGVPQGSIVSPLYFNIYMHEFDLFVQNELQKKVSQFTNYIPGQNNKAIFKDNKVFQTKEYAQLTQKIKNIRARKLRYKVRIRDYEGQVTKREHNQPTKETYRKLINQRLRIKVIDSVKTSKRIQYVRYADDWLLMTNASEKQTIELKTLCKDFLRSVLKLELSEEKTKITDLNKDQAKFLGFNIALYKEKIARIPVVKEGKLTRIYKERTTNGLIKVGIDGERLKNRMIINKFIDKHDKPRTKQAHSVLPAYDIVLYYNSVIRGLTNYYAPCLTNKQFLNKYIYWLAFSCYHTLAQKYRTSLAKIITKYGNPVTVYQETLDKNKKLKRKPTTLIYKQLHRNVYAQAQQRQQEVRKQLFWNSATIEAMLETETVKDPFSVKFLNWRAGTLLLADYCFKCGVSKDKVPIQIHHVKHIVKDKSKGFGQVMNQIKRKQIPVCDGCHKAIHNGTYDGMKLSDAAFPQYADFERIKNKKQKKTYTI